MVNFTRLAQKASNLRSALLEVDPSDLSMEQHQSRRMMEHIVCQVVPSSVMDYRFYFDATSSLFQSISFNFMIVLLCVFRCLYVLNTCVSSQRTSVTLLGRTRHVRLDKDGRKARSFGFAAFLQFGVAKDVLICALSQFRNKLTPCESAQICQFGFHHPGTSAL